MTIFKLLACASALVAVPATAQYYPQPTYPQQYQQYPQTYPGYGQGYGYNQGYGQGYGQNSIGGIIDQLLGNRYNVTDRAAVSRCASAAVAQAQNQYGGGYNQGYGNRYSGQGYNQNYRGQGYGGLRVTAITEVERRSNGLRVSGLLSSGGGGNYGGGYNQGYGNGGYNGNRQLSFRCNVDYNGAVTGLRIR